MELMLRDFLLQKVCGASDGGTKHWTTIKELPTENLRKAYRYLYGIKEPGEYRLISIEQWVDTPRQVE